MKDKICLVTGATSGIGKATALKLAKTGATVVITARDPEKGRTVTEALRALSGNPRIEMIIMDLSDMESIRKGVDSFLKMHNQLHVLINNAGVNLFQRKISKQGYELTFATNFLGPFLLTGLLVDILKHSTPSRIVNVTSSVQSKPDMKDLMHERKYNALQVYAQSKTAIMFYTYELARKLEKSGITVNCLHPGVVRTELARDAQGFFKVLFKIALKFFITPEKGAETSFYLATSKEVETISGKYFVRLKPFKSASYTYDKEMASELWKVGEVYTGFKYMFD